MEYIAEERLHNMRTNRTALMYNALFLDLGGTLVRIEDDEIFTDAAGNVESGRLL